MFDSCYEHTYINNHKEEVDGRIIHLFKFVIRKGHVIIVQVHVLKAHPVAIVKFFDKAYRYSNDRFTKLNGKKKFQPILRTCINIMLEMHRDNPYMSFGFSGAPTTDEIEERTEEKRPILENTKRFRLYRYIMQHLFSPVDFQHLMVESCSAYFLMNRLYCQNKPSVHSEMLQSIRECFPTEQLWDDPKLQAAFQ